MADMTDEDLDEVAAKMSVCKYQTGEAIVSKGDTADGLYQVLSGAAVVEVPDPEAGGSIGAVKVVNRYTPGGYFGEKALISETDSMRKATVRAVEKNTQCLRLEVTDFHSLESYQAILLERQEAIAPEKRERMRRGSGRRH